MKRLLLIFGFLIYNVLLFAQQLPITNQYYFNKFSLAPCYAGFNSGIETYASYRKEAVGFKGAPEGMSLNVNAPILKNSGVGIRIVSDKIDIFSNLFADLSYAQHLKFNDDLKLSLGLYAGIYENRIDLMDVVADDQLIDPVLINRKSHNGIALNSGFGLNLNYKKTLNIGLSVPSIITSENNYSDKNVNYKLQRQYQFFGSYEYAVNEEISLVPLVLIKYLQNAPMNYEFNTNVYYKKKYWAGLNYKKANIAGLNVGLLLSDRIVFNYSYEVGFGGMIGYSSGNHEITLGFIFDKMKLDEDAKKALLEQKAYEKALLSQIDSLKKMKDHFETELRKNNSLHDSVTYDESELIGYNQNDKKTTITQNTITNDTLKSNLPQTNEVVEQNINQNEYFIDNDLNTKKENNVFQPDSMEKVNIVYSNQIQEVVKMDTQLVYSLKQKIETLEKQLEMYKANEYAEASKNNSKIEIADEPEDINQVENETKKIQKKKSKEKNKEENISNNNVNITDNINDITVNNNGDFYSPTGYYIVIGAFEIKENAEDYMAFWRERNVETYIEKVSGKKWYYVYLNKSNYLKEAISKRNDFYNAGFKEIWILILK